MPYIVLEVEHEWILHILNQYVQVWTGSVDQGMNESYTNFEKKSMFEYLYKIYTVSKLLNVYIGVELYTVY